MPGRQKGRKKYFITAVKFRPIVLDKRLSPVTISKKSRDTSIKLKCSSMFEMAKSATMAQIALSWIAIRSIPPESFCEDIMKAGCAGRSVRLFL